MAKIPTADLKARIIEKAKDLGFDLVGVTTPDPPPHLEVYQRWVEAGRHGEMGYLASERNMNRRADPLEILPECQSILVLAMNYLPADASAAQPESPARIASYALGDDYHEVITQRIEQLVTQIEVWLGSEFPHRYYTDTGPILERELAQRAGLGWIGKNTCLIHPRRGSYFFLAELFLGLALPADDPITTDHCGSCTRCLEACPTQCILDDRTIDATRCISYLTIELRHEMPTELRPQVGQWVFGCDICQQVCPWNIRFARPSAEAAYQARPIFEKITPGTFLSMGEREYQQAFKGSPLKRAKRPGLARNAAVAAGNSASPTALQQLTIALHQDEAPLVRRHAAWALGQLQANEAGQILEQALASENDPEVRAEIKLALADK